MQQMREQKVQTDDMPKETANGSNGNVTPDVTESEKSDTSANEDANAAPTSVVESEQATYASANNDLKGTKAYNNADVAGLYTLAMAIIDFRGHRVVAQVGVVIKYQGSILFQDLVGSHIDYFTILNEKSCSILRSFSVECRVSYLESSKGTRPNHYSMVLSIMARKLPGMRSFMQR